MHQTREIPKESWAQYLGHIGQMTRGLPVRVELVGPELGAQTLAKTLPLQGIDLIPKGTFQGSIELDLGREGEVDHRVIQPRRLFAEETEGGELECLEIEDAEANKTLIHFEHPLPLPEGVRPKITPAPEPTVQEYMTASPETVARGSSLAAASKLMSDRGIRHLPVVEGGRLVGILSERDLHLLRKLREINLEQLTVDEAMTRDPYQVSPGARLDEAAAVMSRRKYGAAVVVDAGKVVGILTTTDALRALVDQRAKQRGEWV